MIMTELELILQSQFCYVLTVIFNQNVNLVAKLAEPLHAVCKHDILCCSYLCVFDWETFNYCSSGPMCRTSEIRDCIVTVESRTCCGLSRHWKLSQQNVLSTRNKLTTTTNMWRRAWTTLLPRGDNVVTAYLLTVVLMNVVITQLTDLCIWQQSQQAPLLLPIISSSSSSSHEYYSSVVAAYTQWASRTLNIVIAKQFFSANKIPKWRHPGTILPGLSWQNGRYTSLMLLYRYL